MSAALLRLVRGRIDPRPLALTRIALAVAALLKSADLALALPELAATPALRLPHPWTPAALGPTLGWGLPATTALAAIALALGWRARAAATVLAAAFGAALAADRQLYSNHLLLLVFLLGLLALTDCGAARQLGDRRRGGVDAVPAWPVRLLQTQLTAVYSFAALSKLNAVFLSGAVLAAHLRTTGPLAALAATRAAGPLAVLAIATVAIEAFLAVALWLPRLRPAAIFLGTGLHLVIVFAMEPALPLAVFGLTALAVYPLYTARTLAPAPVDSR